MSNSRSQFVDDEPDPRDILIDAYENRIIPAPRPASGNPNSEGGSVTESLTPTDVVYTWEADNGACLDGAKSTPDAALTIREFARGYRVGIKAPDQLIARDPFTGAVITWTGTPVIPGQRTPTHDDVTAAIQQLEHRLLNPIELAVIEDACRIDQDGSEQTARAALARLRSTLVAGLPGGDR